MLVRLPYLLILSFTLASIIPSANALPLITPQDRTRMDQVISVFENSTLTLQYDYIEALGDGRGYTAGRMGACSGTDDMIEVVREYLALKPDSDFKRILARLEVTSSTESDSIEGLEALPEIWKNASEDPVFRSVQDHVTDLMDYNPALKIAEQHQIQSKLGVLIFYDTMIQHGEGGTYAIARKAMSPAPANETQFLLQFLKARKNELLHPHDPKTRKEWAQSAGRVDALKTLIKHENFDLKGPFQLNPFGEVFTIQ